MSEMNLVIWSAEYSIDLPEVDDQHKGLFACINHLWRAEMEGKSQEMVGQLLEQLHNYTHSHFIAEEALMRMGDYPELEGHIQQHRMFVHKIESAGRDLRRGKRIDLDLLSFLNEWLITHIKVIDHQYADYLRRHQRKGLMGRFSSLFHNINAIFERGEEVVESGLHLDGIDMRHAIDAHAEWNKQLGALLEGQNRETFNAEKVGAHDQCMLGNWIKAQTQGEMSAIPELAELDSHHRAFHRCAGEIVRLHQGGKKREAQALLRQELREHSSRIRLDIIRLFSVHQR